MEPLGDGRLTRTLAREVPPATRAKGTDYYLDGAVVDISGGPSSVEATVRGTLPYRVKVERTGKTFSVGCDCPYFLDRGTVCKHIWAVLLEAEKRGLLDGDAGISSDPEFETRRETARRVAAQEKAAPRQWEKFLHDFSEKLAREEALARAPKFAGAQIVYVIDRGASTAGQSLALDLMSRQRTRQGKWGKPKPAGVSTRDVESLPESADREIVPMLLGASDVYGTGYVGDFGR